MPTRTSPYSAFRPFQAGRGGELWNPRLSERLAAAFPRAALRDLKANFRLHGTQHGFSRKISEWCEDSLELLAVMCQLAPASRQRIFSEGSRFFARANYHRAISAPSPSERVAATLKVMKYFRYRQLPSARLALNILYGTRLYSALRLVKRQAVRPFRAITAG